MWKPALTKCNTSTFQMQKCSTHTDYFSFTCVALSVVGHGYLVIGSLTMDTVKLYKQSPPTDHIGRIWAQCKNSAAPVMIPPTDHTGILWAQWMNSEVPALIPPTERENLGHSAWTFQHQRWYPSVYTRNTSLTFLGWFPNLQNLSKFCQSSFLFILLFRIFNCLGMCNVHCTCTNMNNANIGPVSFLPLPKKTRR